MIVSKRLFTAMVVGANLVPNPPAKINAYF